MSSQKKYTTLRLILGDQLNRNHSWFQRKDDDVLYVMMEVLTETSYVRHHIQKVLGFFAAMRAFARELERAGHQVLYLKLDDVRNLQSFPANLQWTVAEHSILRLEYQEPDEYRLDVIMREFCDSLESESHMVSSEHFLTEREDLSEFFKGKKTYIMENFYRDMRKKHELLMQSDGQPVGGRWNYDVENRKKIPKTHRPPEPLLFEHDLSQLHDMITHAGVETLGTVDAQRFTWPIDRKESLELLEFFVRDLLVHFGTFQDAMTPEYWALYHSRLSFALNTKMLSPKEVVERVIEAWEADKETIDIAQVEGFVRQIIGWREYMRGVYWAHMPSYAEKNFFQHDRKLPEYYWTGETSMACVSHAVKQSLEYAYAHHIQRLMVTGNFALLAGIDPDQLDAWYLGIYIDAIEWVEITNTRGMSQFADGGIVGTKPYVSSASYMHKMGHHCAGCRYDHKKKVGEDACPFNSLYWHFLDRHRDRLAKNHRMSMMYRVWDRMDRTDKQDIIAQAEHHLEHLEEL